LYGFINTARGYMMIRIDDKRRLVLAMQHVQQYGSITSGEYRELKEVSENTATRDLELLVQRGALKIVGKTRGRKYTKP
jgi:predicted HTH transcriptional regulator